LLVGERKPCPNAAGWSPNTPQGIFRSAQLVVYPQACISDVFVRPSVANAGLYYDVWDYQWFDQFEESCPSGNLTSWNGDNWSYTNHSRSAVSVAAGSVSKVTIGPVRGIWEVLHIGGPNVPYQSGYTAKLHNLNLYFEEWSYKPLTPKPTVLDLRSWSRKATEQTLVIS